MRAARIAISSFLFAVTELRDMNTIYGEGINYIISLISPFYNSMLWCTQ